MHIAEWIVLAVLAGFAAYDIKAKCIPIRAVAIFGVVVFVYRLCTGAGFLKLAAGLIPGVALLLLAYVTRESIGKGDGLVLCVVGVYCGVVRVLAVLGMALVLSSLLAMVLLVARRAGRKTELPFLPCLFAGYLLCMVW